MKIRDGRKKITDLPGFYVRGIDHEVPDRGSGEEFFTVVTTILNPEEANAVELAAAYHERWEIEVTFDEVKTHQRGPGAILRSMSPEMITQELWELLLTHYCVRKLMTEAADQADIDPDRLSFIRSLRVVRRQVTSQAAFSPERLAQAILETITEIVERPNPERQNRSNPHEVKRHQHNGYTRKRPGSRGMIHSSPPRLKILAPA